MAKCNLAAGIILLEVLITLFLLTLFLHSIYVQQALLNQEARGNYYFALGTRYLQNFLAEKIFHGSIDPKELEEINRMLAQQIPYGGLELSAGGIALAWGSHRKAPCRQNEIGISGCLYFPNTH